MDDQPRLVANVIETKAKTIPNAPWLMYANSSAWEQEGGYKTITWKQCANAINKMAHFLDENIPIQNPGRQTIAYQGPNDPRYYIIMAAAAKSKRTVCGSIYWEVLVRNLAEFDQRSSCLMGELPKTECSRYWTR